MNKTNVIQFLECYEKYPCLWNPREDDYRNNNIRLAALKSIIEEMRLNITVEELKLKIKNMRTTYNREASKIVASKKSGAGTDDIYKPQLLWFSTADRFLKPVIEGRTSKDNMIEAQENAANSDSSSYFEELGQGYQSECPVKKKKFLSPKKTLAKTVRTPTGEVLEAVNKLESMAQNISQDEFDIFGQYVANQLRNLPLINAIECQNFVTNYLSQERIKYLSTSRPTSSASDNTRDELIRRPLSRPMSSASDSTRDELIRRPPSRPMSSASDNTRDELIRRPPSRPKSSASDNTRDELIRRPPSRPKSSASDNTRDELIRRPPSRTLSSASDSARDELSRRPTSTPTGSKLIRGTLKSQLPNATITSSAYESLHGPSASPVDVDIEENFFGDNTCDELIHRPTTTPTGSKLIRGTLKSQLPNATITSSAYESLHRPSASPVDIEENFFGDSVNSKKGENLDILSQAITTSLGTDFFDPTSFNDMNDF